MSVHLDFDLPGGIVTVPLKDPAAIPLVGDLIFPGPGLTYRIVSRRFDFFNSSPPTGDVTILIEGEQVPGRDDRNAK
jgi:hypothetical protein